MNVYKSIFFDENIDNKISVTIPYLCKLDISWNEKFTNKGVTTVVKIDAEPCEALVNEIKSIEEGNTPPSCKFMEKEIMENLLEKLEIYDIEISDISGD